MKKLSNTQILILIALSLVVIFLLFFYTCKEKVKTPQDPPIFSPQVYYGTKVAKDEIPWQAAVVIEGAKPEESIWGGGIIIDSKWILTAAHLFEYMNDENTCVVEEDFNNFRILTGTIDLTKGGVKSKIKEVYIPDDYVANGTFNDIALIELEDELKLDISSQKRIYVPTENDYLEYTLTNTLLTVAGWGIDENGDFPTILHKAEVPIADHKTCQQNNFDQRRIVTDDMICAGYIESGEPDACGGDSGGPLFVLSPNDNPILIGIVSWGVGCSTDGLYGVYTDFYKYLNWVNENCDYCLMNEPDLDNS